MVSCSSVRTWRAGILLLRLVRVLVGGDRGLHLRLPVLCARRDWLRRARLGLLLRLRQRGHLPRRLACSCVEVVGVPRGGIDLLDPILGQATTWLLLLLLLVLRVCRATSEKRIERARASEIIGRR